MGYVLVNIKEIEDKLLYNTEELPHLTVEDYGVISRTLKENDKLGGLLNID